MSAATVIIPLQNTN